MVSNHSILGHAHRNGVIQKTERDVQSNEHLPVSDRVAALNWDDIRLFKTVASEKSLRKAAVGLKLSVNTVRTRIRRLEDSLGSALFARNVDGISLTAEGMAVLDIALDMQLSSFRLITGRGDNSVTENGELRICCSEGIGEFWLTPRLAELQEQLPGLTVSLRSDFDQSRIHSHDSDVRIGFMRPTDPDAIVTKLATLHFLLYASDDYLRRHGQPRSFEDAEKHKFIVQEAPGLHNGTMTLFLGEEVAKRLTVTKVNTSYSLYWAISRGLGIGALPTYVRAISRNVHPLDLPLQLKFDLWMSYTRSIRGSQPVRAAIDWLKECFDTQKYPWFADHFVHPNDFADNPNDAQIIPLYNIET